jgi:hypothetical protein
MSLTIEESKALLALCRAGKLYDIERWISAGKPTVADSSLRKTALLTAMETGFHNLVELLARHEQRQEQKDRALADAVERKRLDMLAVLVEHGGRIESVPFDDVLLTWERSIMRFFLDHGADAVTGKPFGIAFQAKVQNALRIRGLQNSPS